MRFHRRWVSRLTATAVSASVLVLAATMLTPAGAQSEASLRRLEGPTRYETAVAIADATAEGSEEFAIILARGDDFADALAANYILSLGPGVVLLTPPDKLHPATAEALRRYNANGLIIMGGPSAISPAVEDEVRAMGIAVERIFGEDRYETAARANHPCTREESCVPAGGAVLVASGQSFADALSAGPWSQYEAMPLFLTQRDDLPDASADAIRGNALRVYVVGGPDVVSDAVLAELRGLGREDDPDGVEVIRIAGKNRRETAVKVAEEMRRPTTIYTHVNIARGDTFPDALAGGPHSGYEGAPILLTESPTVLGTETEAYLRQISAEVISLDVFGDETAVSDAVAEQARIAARVKAQRVV